MCGLHVAIRYKNAHIMKWMLYKADQGGNIRHDAANEVRKKNQLFNKSMMVVKNTILRHTMQWVWSGFEQYCS